MKDESRTAAGCLAVRGICFIPHSKFRIPNCSGEVGMGYFSIR